ncbi:helix-turn-helix transcriptional regulator [Paracandidimonas soli]|uniref:helix-turn-helix transcriptional regulator n=1 Tax=Paracandidimonas soli TaxID=1917182 RepID=UPI0033427659
MGRRGFSWTPFFWRISWAANLICIKLFSIRPVIPKLDINILLMLGNILSYMTDIHPHHSAAMDLRIRSVILSHSYTAITLMKNPLSSREQLCLHWAAQGKTSWEIGAILGLAESTINFHMANICRKLGVTRRQAAITIAAQTGFLAPPARTGASGTKLRSSAG